LGTIVTVHNIFPFVLYNLNETKHDLCFNNTNAIKKYDVQLPTNFGNRLQNCISANLKAHQYGMSLYTHELLSAYQQP